MKTQALITSTIALTLIGSAIVSFPKASIAGQFKDRSVHCYFVKGEVIQLNETCTSDGVSWGGGGGHSLKWNDGVVTLIKFGRHGRGERVCPSEDQMSVDDVCGKSYYRSAKTFRRTDSTNGDLISCVQLERNSVCWKF